MTQETLQKANDLQKIIASYKDHLMRVKKAMDDDNCMIVLMPENGPITNLSRDFLPISLQDFIFPYISNVEDKINELEDEFEALKD